MKYIIILLLSFILFACNTNKEEVNKPDKESTEVITKDSVSVSIENYYWDDSIASLYKHGIDSRLSDSSYKLILNDALSNELIDEYYKDIYRQDKLISADDNKMLSITDSLFTNNPSTDLFYFIVFTKSMNGSDGFYSEAVGLSAYDYIVEKTESFADYFNSAPKLDEKDMNNWALYIYAELQISKEGQELKAITDFETLVLKNIKESKRENRLVIEALIIKIRTAHNNRHK